MGDKDFLYSRLNTCTMIAAQRPGGARSLGISSLSIDLANQECSGFSTCCGSNHVGTMATTSMLTRVLVHELTHCGLVMPYGDIVLGQHWFWTPGYAVMPDSTKPLPERTLTSHQWGFAAFTWQQCHTNCPSYYSVQWNWKLHNSKITATSPKGPWWVTWSPVIICLIFSIINSSALLAS